MKKGSLRLVTAPVVALLVCLPANASVLSYVETLYSTNLATSAVGMRGTGSGILDVGGISGTVTTSLLFWHAIANSAQTNLNPSLNVNGHGITGTNIGFSSDNLWGGANSQAYRAEITSLVAADARLVLSNFQNADTLVNGAAAFTLYDSGSLANKRDVMLYQGNDSNLGSTYDAAGWDFMASCINYSGGQAFLTLYVSDGQSFADGTLSIDGTPIAGGGIFQGAAPGVNVGNGTLTDIVRYDISSFLMLGINSLHITLEPGGSDAVSLVAAAIDLPSNSNSLLSPTPEAGTIGLVGAALTALIAFGRSRTRG